MWVALNNKGSNKKKSVNRNYFCHENFYSGDLFSAAPCGLMLALQKDVLFHSTQVTGAMRFKIQGQANRLQPGPSFQLWKWSFERHALMLLLRKTAQLKV
jgi:hypothetical protein